MTVKVSFMKPGGLGSIHAPGIGDVRICELLTLGGTVTTAASALDGEIAVLMSTETGPCIAAHGTTPSATATARTTATSAGYGVPVGIPFPIVCKVGDKIHIAAFA